MPIISVVFCLFCPPTVCRSICRCSSIKGIIPIVGNMACACAVTCSISQIPAFFSVFDLHSSASTCPSKYYPTCPSKRHWFKHSRYAIFFPLHHKESIASPSKQKRSANSGAFPESADLYVQTTPKTLLCSAQLSGMPCRSFSRVSPLGWRPSQMSLTISGVRLANASVRAT